MHPGTHHVSFSQSCLCNVTCSFFSSHACSLRAIPSSMHGICVPFLPCIHDAHTTWLRAQQVLIQLMVCCALRCPLRSVTCVTSHVTVADTTHYLETECMREAMEQVLYSNGVDVVLNGHLHEYERTNPVFVSHLRPCLLCVCNTAAETSITSCHSRAAQNSCITACSACSRPAFAN